VESVIPTLRARQPDSMMHRIKHLRQIGNVRLPDVTPAHAAPVRE